MFDVICAGMALVDSIICGFDPKPVSASGYVAASGTLAVGGEAVNTASASARLGMKTAILCGLGRDAAGKLIAGALEGLGVDTGRIVPIDATPVSTIFVSDNGQRKSITNGAHRRSFRPEKNPALLAGARALILGSLFRAPFDDPDALVTVLTEAKQAGETVFADTKLPNFRRLGLTDFSRALPLVDYITPNRDEAAYFTGREDPDEMADVFLSFGVRNVIVKLGADGCLLKGRAGRVRLPGYPVNAVDTTGAGDSFLAGFVCEILRGQDEARALGFANACGAISTTQVGAGEALKSRAQVTEWMKTARWADA